METVRIIPLGRLSTKLSHCLRDAQMEAAEVWNCCCELHKEARRDGAKWPNRDDLQRATKGRFKLHSQTVQMIAHQLLDNVEATRKLRREHPEMGMKYPCRTKGYFTLMWPAQAASIKGNRVILPMGRGRKSIVLKGIDMPDGAGACKMVWRGGYELHVSRGRTPTTHTNTDRADSPAVHACVDPGEIPQCAVATSTGDALVVSGRGGARFAEARQQGPGTDSAEALTLQEGIAAVPEAQLYHG